MQIITNIEFKEFYVFLVDDLSPDLEERILVDERQEGLLIT